MTNGGSADPGVVLDVWYPDPELATPDLADTKILEGDDIPTDLPFEVLNSALGPRPPAKGFRRPCGGWAANVEPGAWWQSTTAEMPGFYPFPAPSGARVRGVPIGRNLHTAEPIGLDPAQWLVDGLVTNTGIWVQGQPGIGKSSFLKRLLMGLVGFGFMGIIPGDLKDEYTPLVDAIGGEVGFVDGDPTGVE